MSRLSLTQKQKLGEIIQEKGVLDKINELLHSYGLEDIQATEIKLKPIREDAMINAKFRRICRHGYEMVQNCEGGTCYWECAPGHNSNA